MKKLAVVLVLAMAGLLAYNFATTGELTLKPSFTLSAEEEQLRDLERDFNAAKKSFAQAHRAAAVGGLDTTADVEAAKRAVRGISKDLQALKKKLSGSSRKPCAFSGLIWTREASC